jgi:transposase
VIGMNADDSFPGDIEILKQLLRTREAELSQARAEASNARAEALNARAEASSAEALITHLRLTIEKLKRDLFGPRNERKARLIDQMELQLEELEAAATEDGSRPRRRQQLRRCAPSRAASPPGRRSRRICRASGSLFPAPPPAPAAARPGLPSWART